jgi:hypothetical protein
MKGGIKMEISNRSYVDILDQIRNSRGRIDIKATIESFWKEMAKLLHDYAELSFNPDPDKTLQIGNMFVRGDQVNSPAASLVLEDRLNQIENAQTALMDIWDRMRKLEDRLNSTT